MEQTIEVRTSDSHPLRIDTIVLPVKGHDGKNARIGLTLAPGKKVNISSTLLPKGLVSWSRSINKIWQRDLEKDVQAIKNYGADIVVTLMDSVELRKFDMIGKSNSLFEMLKANQIHSVHYPIKESTLPKDKEDFLKFIESLAHLIEQGKTVVIHCSTGRGRTGLVAACLLTALGQPLRDSLEKVKSTRPKTLSCRQQQTFIQKFSGYWNVCHGFNVAE